MKGLYELTFIVSNKQMISFNPACRGKNGLFGFLVVAASAHTATNSFSNFPA